MTNRLFRNFICILFLLGLGFGLTGLCQQKEAIKAQSRPHWVTVEGSAR